MDIDFMLKNIPDKRQYKETTSLQFKRDLIKLFSEMGKDHTVLEVGTNHGHTTRILSFLFKNVITLDWREEPNLRMAKELNADRDNITYIEKDVYASSWDDLNLPKFEVSFIDCNHEYGGVVSDILNCTNYGNSEQYIIFDDYGHPKTGVKKAIQDTINQNDNFNIVEYIGEPKGSDCRPGLILTDYEGVVCKFLKTETEPQWWEEK
tara:strand:- start:1048 stop:1668 length:621 start_codon:yes stop_codon:yes gene_type:complete